jgi:hypothetical protein
MRCSVSIQHASGFLKVQKYPISSQNNTIGEKSNSTAGHAIVFREAEGRTLLEEVMASLRMRLTRQYSFMLET